MISLTWVSNRRLKEHWLEAALFLLGLGVRGGAALRLAGPQYLDAEYYFMLAQNLVQGKGWMLNAIWQFLDGPRSLPHPAGGLWLPLPSLVQAVGLLFGQGYRYAQIPQVVLCSLAVVLAFRFAYELTERRSDALLAALLMLFGGGTVMVRQVDVDCYATYVATAGAALYAMYRGQRSAPWLCVSGLFMGLASLTRNDGLLLVVLFLVYLAWLSWQGLPYSRRAALGALVLFLIVMAPWWVRNWVVFGRPNPVPVLYPALLRQYVEFFAYNPRFTWEHFVSWGWQWQLQARLQAAWHNLAQAAWVFQCWQLPFVVLGAWTMRRRHTLFPIVGYPVASFLVLSLVYPFPSTHGTWLHSLSAFVPFGAAFAALGLRVAWKPLVERTRALRPSTSYAAMACIAVFVALVWGMALAQAEIASNQRWNAGREAIARWIRENTPAHSVVMSNDPLGVTLSSGRGGVTIPDGGLDDALQVMDDFHADYLILWKRRPQGIPEQLLVQIGVSDRLRLVDQWDEVQVYALDRAHVTRVGQ